MVSAAFGIAKDQGFIRDLLTVCSKSLNQYGCGRLSGIEESKSGKYRGLVGDVIKYCLCEKSVL